MKNTYLFIVLFFCSTAAFGFFNQQRFSMPRFGVEHFGIEHFGESEQAGQQFEAGDALLMESGDFLLLEDGASKILLE